MIARRRFLGALAASGVAGVHAQPASDRVFRLGILRPTALPAVMDATSMEAVLPKALAELGYVEGRNLTVYARYADGDLARLPELARSLVAADVNVIVAVTVSAVRAAMRATTTIPIVIWGNFDPVTLGFVKSFSRPGGNVTGVLISADGTLAAKKLELLREVVPTGRRITVLGPEDPATLQSQLPELERVAPALGVDLAVVTVRNRDYARAFAEIAATKPASVFVAATTYFLFERKPIIELAIQHRLPTIWEWREQVVDGGFMAYGTSLASRLRLIAVFVDRIFRGIKPGDIPIEQPTKFELTFNMATARAIGVTVPRPLLLRADEVIS